MRVKGWREEEDVDGQEGNSFHLFPMRYEQTELHAAAVKSKTKVKFSAGQSTHTPGVYILLPQLYKISCEILVHYFEL